MSRSQLILTVSTLIIVAILLHISLCEWGYKSRYRTPVWVGDPLLAYQHEDGRLYTGLFSQRALGSGDRNTTTRLLHLLFGLIIPLLLASTAAYLLLGWSRRSRMHRGCCPECGYDLRGAAEGAKGVCPECGWRGSRTAG